MRVGFLGHADPRNPRSFSGTYLSMIQSIEAQGVEVVVLPWWRDERRLRDLAGRKVAAARKLMPSNNRHASRVHARVVESSLRDQEIDLIFAAAAHAQLAELRSPVPVVYASDATFALLVDKYPHFSNLSPAARRQGAQLESQALRRAVRYLYSSAWAAEAAIRSYQIDPALVSIAPLGPNLTVPTSLLEREWSGSCELLFVGREWERKGGDIAIATTAMLRERGVDAHLTVCGASPLDTPSFVTVVPLVDRSAASGVGRIEKLFEAADVFLLPSRADCSPIALCEAAAYGVPAVASNVGGISELIVEGQTGALVAAGATPDAYADAVLRVWQDPQTWRRGRLAARARHEEVLNWEAWSSQAVSVLESALTDPVRSRR